MNVLVEAVGSPGWPTLTPYLRSAFVRIVGLEIDPLAARAGLVDACHVVPRHGELSGPEQLFELCARERVDVVLPSVDEGLGFWSRHREAFAERGVQVVVSPLETVELFADKWKTYRFFEAHGVPTPETSLSHEYGLVKPRCGRGGAGVRRVAAGSIRDDEMQGLVSQRPLTGQELSIDVLCDLQGRAAYKVQRERLETASGISVRGRVVNHPEVDRFVDRVLSATPFHGIANIQCFVESDGVFFTEVNARIPGGLSLSMAATENWFPPLLKLLRSLPIETVEVRHGLEMLRHFRDVFVDAGGPTERDTRGRTPARCRDADESSSSRASARSTTSSSP